MNYEDAIRHINFYSRKIGFKFKDIKTNDVFQDGLHCVHLFGTPIGVLS